MNKIRITADAVLAIIRGIFEDEDVDVIIDDTDAPETWRGKKISEILNIEYFTFKHRAKPTQDVIKEILAEKGQVNELAALNCAFCGLAVDNIERLFSKDVDTVVLQASLGYYIQTSKIKLLEYLIEDSNIAVCGLRIPVKFGKETRRAVVFFDRPNIGDIMTAAPFGEVANVDVDVAVLLYPDVASYSDYTVNIGFTDNGDYKSADVPLTSFSLASVMTQDAVPGITHRETVGEINLSRATSFVLVFDGFNNAFVNYLTAKSFAPGGVDNNQPFTVKVTRGENTYTHEMIVKDHKITVNADTGNETHTVTFVKRGKKNGVA